MKRPLSRIVEVLWDDITSHNAGWVDRDTAIANAQLTTVYTVGYVLEDTPRILKLAMMQAMANDGEVGVTCTIPKGVIRRMKTLKGL